MGSVNTAQYTLGDSEMPSVKKKEANGKPPYRVPSMAEINTIPWNGLTVISTFSGCGGSSLGYRMAGFKVLWASEFVPAARESYLANCHPDTVLDDRDIRLVQPQGVLDACGLKEGELDLFDGSPPCASFSTAGKRQAGWGQVKKYSDVSQRTDDLFFEYVRLLRGIKPRAFVAENVSGLVKGTAKGYFLMILKELKESGYRVSCRVLDAQWLGVPQQRQRTIFVGVREDLVDAKGQPIQPCHPSPLPYRYSVREAIPWITGVGKVPGGDFDKKGRESVWTNGLEPSPTVTATIDDRVMAEGRVEVCEDTFDEHRVYTDKAAPSVRAKKAGHINVRSVEPEADMSGYATGAEHDAMNAPGGTNQQSDRYFQLVKPSLEEACPTITSRGGDATAASVCHPIERRKFSIAELRRICAFPDCFILTGTYAAQWERLGRAVPPVMMAWIARTVRDEILLKASGDSPWENDLSFLREAVEYAKKHRGKILG